MLNAITVLKSEKHVKGLAPIQLTVPVKECQENNLHVTENGNLIFKEQAEQK